MRLLRLWGILITLLLAFALAGIFLGGIGSIPSPVRSAAAELQSLAVFKTANVSTAAPGQAVTFMLTVTADFTGTIPFSVPVVITETLPAEMELLDATPGFTPAAGSLVWMRPFSTVIGYDVVTFTARITDALLAYTPIINADYRARLLDVEVAGHPVTLTVAPMPALLLGAVPSPQPVQAGQSILLSYPVTNTGNFTDTFNFVTALQAPLAGWEVTLPSSVTLAAGESDWAVVQVTAGPLLPDEVITNTLWVTCTSASDINVWDVVTTELVVQNHSLESLAVIKTADLSSVAPGQAITFILTVTTDFSGTLPTVLPAVITETLPANLQLLDATPGFTPITGSLVWTRPFSTVIGYEVVTFTARLADSLPAYTPIVNADYRARLLDVEVTGRPITLTVAAVPGLTLRPAPSPQYVDGGELLHLHYPLTNTGNVIDTFSFSYDLQPDSTLTDWQVTLPPSMTLSAGETINAEVWVTVGDIPAGETLTATFSLTGTSALGAMGHVTTEIVARYRSYLYLPLVLRSYPPKPIITSAAIQTPHGGSGYTYVPGVQVVVSATVENDIVQGIRFRTAGGTWGNWQPFTPEDPYTYTFAGTSGYKGLYIEARGAKGGISDPHLVSMSLLYNGDFRNGLTSWGTSNQVMPSPTVADGRALLGNPTWPCNAAPIGSSNIYQTLDLTQVPTGHTITLYLDYDIRTEDKLTTGDYDRFVVLVNNQEIHRDGYRGSDTYGCGHWHQVTRVNHTLDLSAHRGKTIQVLFGNYTRYDNWYNTYTYVDNIRLIVQP